MGYLLEFRDATPQSIFGLAPETAIEWFKAKGLKPTFSYRDMIQEEHDVAFTVAKMMDVDLLRTTQDLVDKGMAQGWSKERFTQELAPKLQAAGWWGAKDMTDPLTGANVTAQLGSAHRIKNIYRSNLQSAYSVGQWERIHEQAEEAPYLLYDAVDDQRTREEHAQWDNLVLPISDPFWRAHMPPNGYQCRCGVIQLSEEELEAMGLKPSKPPKVKMKDWTNPRTGKTHKVPEGIDPGWAHNPGQRRMESLQELMAEKVQTLPPAAQQAFEKGVKAYQTQAAAKAAKAAMVKEEGASQLQRSKAKIQEASAAWQINNHLDKKTPYMAAAIKAVQKTKGSDQWPSTKVLAQAAEKAEAAEKSAFLTTYKQYVTKGKEPPAKAQAVFDALPAAEKAKVNEQMAALQAKKAAEQALAELEDGSGAYAKALKKLKDNGQAEGMTPVQLWKAVTEEAEAQKAKISKAVNLANYKKAVVDGKQPKDNQLAAYKALEPDEKASIDDEVANLVAAKEAAIKEAKEAAEAAAAKVAADKAAAEAAQAAAAKPKPKAKPKAKAKTATEEAMETLEAYKKAKAKEAAAEPPGPLPGSQTPQAGPVINPDKLVRIGPQKGSNPGGLFLDEETGTKWYIKKPDTEDIARNEVLAGKLYQATGIEAPDLELIEFEGSPAIASRIIDGLESGDGPALAKAGGAKDGFVADAWLANWDVVGLGYDNLLLKGGRAVRVDTGGALVYRAQGGSKGAAWGNTVDELDTLRNPSTNPQAASVFGDISQEEMIAGARKVLAVTDDQIEDLVARYGPTSTKAAGALVKTLKARREDIARRFPEATSKPKAAAKPKDSGKRVTQAEASRIDESRGNGYGVATDKDQVEDQEVLFWRETGADKTERTAGEFKLTARGMAAIERSLPQTKAKGDDNTGPVGSLNKDKAEMDDDMLEAFKGMKANQGTGLRNKDINRAVNAIIEYEAMVDVIKTLAKAGQIPQSTLEDFRQHYAPFVAIFRQITDTPVGTKDYLDPKLVFEPKILKDKAAPKPKGDKAPEIAWKKTLTSKIRKKEIRRGYLQDTGQEVETGVDQAVWEADVDGVRVQYWGDDQSLHAMQGRMRIVADGKDADAAARVYAAMEKMGIDTSRPGKADAEELYLIQSLYAINRNWRTTREVLDSLDSQPKRIKYMKEKLKEQTGRDVTALPTYKPEGRREAFDTGHVRRYRPEMHGKEWDSFTKEHRLIHENYTSMPMTDLVDLVLNGGGKMITTTEKIRRGIPLAGMSPEADLKSGGANYFFTRIRKKRSADRTVGFVWKSEQAARLDAITYDGDKYGRTSGDFVTQNRLGDVEGMKKAAGNQSNETIFKNGLSLFDGLESIQVSSAAEKADLFKIFKKHGYDTWPDGRKLGDVIKVISR